MSLRPGAVNFEEKWCSLQETITAVVQLHAVRHTTWNDHYSDIYALCEAFPKSYAETLYKETRTLLLCFVAKLLENVLESQSLLSTYQHHWLCYQQGAKYLDNLFSYFNRVPLRKYQSQPDVLPCHVMGIATPPGPTPNSTDTPIQIRYMALKVWKEGVLEPLHHHLVAGLLEEVRRERDGEPADLSMVRDVIGSFIEVEEGRVEEPLRYYQDCFECPFLVETGQYYRLEAARMVAELSCSEYIKQVVIQLKTAKRAGNRFLHQTSVTKFVRECEARLVVHYKDSYIYTHTRDMVRQENATDLSNLFILFSNIPKALQHIVQEFQEHVKEQGTLVLQQLYQDKGYGVTEFVRSVLDIHSKYENMVNSLFSNHRDFSVALDQACRAFVNIPEKPRQQPKAPLLLARYCDQLLRKSSSKGVSEGEVEEKLQDAITVFRYIEDKDTFQRFYSRMLCRRLVQNLSMFMEAEETMIYKLKHACGYEYTSRLQRMVLDIRLSSDAMTEFQENMLARQDTLPVSFSTLVLQSAAWPLQKLTCSVAIPPHLQLTKTKFEEFYTSKHNGRVLSWLHHLSVAELSMTYLKKAYTVCVSTYQMAVLLAYNQGHTHSTHSLGQLTRLPSQELSSTIQSLLDSKILESTRSKAGEGEGEGDKPAQYMLNMNYANKRTKFKITAMLHKDTPQEIEQTLYNVTEDRKLHIQAAIVRVMKARKILQHNQLIQEAISQVRSRFNPNVQMIKRCVETLMEKQYLERQDGARDMYMYVA